MAEFQQWKAARNSSGAVDSSRQSLLDHLESTVQQRHREYKEMAMYKEELSHAYYHQVERMHVLTKASEFFQFESRAGLVADLDPEYARHGISRHVFRCVSDVC